jgi:hypothetical protein
MSSMYSNVMVLLQTSLPLLHQSERLSLRSQREKGTESQSSRRSLLFLRNSIPLLMWLFMKH